MPVAPQAARTAVLPDRTCVQIQELILLRFEVLVRASDAEKFCWLCKHGSAVRRGSRVNL